MSPYAAKTEVPVDRTKAEIERLVVGVHGANQYMTGHQSNPPRAMIQFRLHDRVVRFELPLPVPDGGPTKKFTEQRLLQKTRARWRALLLVIKAKLEAVDSGVTTFEEEFLAHIVMPGDKTVAQYVVPQLASAYATGKLPPLLPEFTEDRT